MKPLAPLRGMWFESMRQEVNSSRVVSVGHAVTADVASSGCMSGAPIAAVNRNPALNWAVAVCEPDTMLKMCC